MATKRNKPRLGITVDEDVYRWAVACAKKKRLKVSQLVNLKLADIMVSECKNDVSGPKEGSLPKPLPKGKRTSGTGTSEPRADRKTSN